MVEQLNRIIDEIPPCFLQFSLTSTNTSSLEITKTFWNKMQLSGLGANTLRVLGLISHLGMITDQW